MSITARQHFIAAAQHLMWQGPRVRYLGICYNIDEILEDIGADLNGYTVISALSREYADFADHNPGVWGPVGSEGDLFRFQWLRDKIAEVQSLSDEQFEAIYDLEVANEQD